MEIVGMVFLAFMVIAFFAFIYVIVKSARGWGGLHSTMLVFIFLFSLVFMYSSAGVLHRRVTWIRLHDQRKMEMEKLEKKAFILQYGDYTRSTPEDVALIPASNKLIRLTLDRGRVWRNVQLQNATKSPAGGIENVRLEIVARAASSDPVTGLPVVASAVTEGIPAQLLVYAFGDVVTAEGLIIPKIYLGEFFVDSTEGTRSVLRPTSPLLPQQIDSINNSTARWSIYELMPLDSHEAFAEVGSEPSNDAIFGRMDPKTLSELLGIPADLLDIPANELANKEQARKANLLRSYTDDGKPGNEESPPESLWIRVEFLKEYTVEVDSTTSSSQEGGYFDPSGRTVDSRIKRGEQKSTVVFKGGESKVFLKATADELIDQGIAKLTERIYVRPLNDYEFAFRNTKSRRSKTVDNSALLNRLNAIVSKTNQKSEELIGIRQVERQRLDKDLAQFEKERDVIQGEMDRLTGDLATTRTKLIALFNEQRSLHKQIVDSQLGMAQAINAVAP